MLLNQAKSLSKQNLKCSWHIVCKRKQQQKTNLSLRRSVINTCKCQSDMDRISNLLMVVSNLYQH